MIFETSSDVWCGSHVDKCLQVVSITLAGAAVGSLSGTILADAFGRVRAFLIDCIPLLAGAFFCATASTYNTMLLGRTLCGLGIGLSSALVPLYISEVAPTSVRGRLGTANQIMICVGILTALVVNVAMPPTAWRQMFALSAIPAGLLALGALIAHAHAAAGHESRGQLQCCTSVH